MKTDEKSSGPIFRHYSYRTKQNRRNLEGRAGSLRLWMASVDEAGVGRLVQRGGERATLVAAGADKLDNPIQVILRLIAIALFELP
jgi:hypothetical protein